jgi:hypothetical protein
MLRGQFGGFLEPAPFLKALARPESPKPPATPSAGPELDARIKKNIQMFDKRAPKEGVSHVLGSRKQTLGEWVKEQNVALHDLRRIGKPAVPALLHAVEHGSPRTADRCAVALGWMKAPEAKKPLVALLTHRRAHVRVAAATSMGLYYERAFLPALRARLQDRKEVLRVRVEAARAIRSIAASYGGIDDPAVAKALLDATRIDNARLRWECLQSLIHIDSPIDLSALFPLMEDPRVGGFGRTVSTNACWVFMRLCGHRLVRIDGAEFEGYAPKVISFLKSWYEREKENLVWDPERKHFRLRKS